LGRTSCRRTTSCWSSTTDRNRGHARTDQGDVDDLLAVSEQPCRDVPNALRHRTACEWPRPAGRRVTVSRTTSIMIRMTQRQRVSSGAAWEPIVGYSRAVRVGSWVLVAGTTAALEGGGAVGGDDMGAQTREALRRIALALEQVGATLQDVVRTRMFVTDISRWEEVGRAHGEVFGAIRPATSMVEVTRLIDSELLVEIEADAIIP
jgi:enamine deaminase RidA (YjgF/YER057c/UK114 family)